MSFINKLLAPIFKRGMDEYFTEYKNDMSGLLMNLYSPTQSGVVVTEEQAERLATVYTCTGILSDAVASLPLHLYKRMPDGRGKERADDDPLYRILHEKPNRDTTSYSFRECMMKYLLNCGNAYAFIERTGKYSGDIRALWQMDSRRMNIRREEGGGLIYRYESPTGTEYTDYRQNQILHIVGPTKNGVYGKSVISAARESIGLAIAAEDFGASFFANGAHLSGLLTHPGARDEAQEKNILTSWRKKYSGHGKTGSIGMLWGGMDYKTVGVAPDDAQFLQTRKQQKEDIAAIFRVPKWMVGADDKTGVGGKDTEQKGIWFVMYSLRPWLVRFEQAIQTQLIKKSGYFAEFNIDGLLRGDAKTRNEAYQIQRQNGVITINEWRRKENMNPAMDADGAPIPEADEYQLMNIWTNLKQMSMDSITPTEPPEETSEGAVGGEAEGGNRTRDLPKFNVRSLQTLQTSYFPVFEDAARRIINREVADIGREAEKRFGKSDRAKFDEGDFKIWIDEFYDSHMAFIEKNMVAPLNSYAKAIHGTVSESFSNPQAFEALEGYIDRYMKSISAQHVMYSRAKIKNLFDIEDIESASDMLDAIKVELNVWQETRPEKIAMKEATRAGGAISREVYKLNDVSKIIWVASGGSCPLCDEMDGQVVGIEQAFVEKGSNVKGKDAEGNWVTLKAPDNVFHPPLHQGCVCTIAPQ